MNFNTRGESDQIILYKKCYLIWKKYNQELEICKKFLLDKLWLLIFIFDAMS